MKEANVIQQSLSDSPNRDIEKCGCRRDGGRVANEKQKILAVRQADFTIGKSAGHHLTLSST